MKELILYVAEKSVENPKYGMTKLNKILFYSDFTTYWKQRVSITDQKYMRVKNGPVLKKMLPLLDEMKASGDIRIETRKYGFYHQQRVVALRKPDLSLFTTKQRAIVDEILVALKDDNASEVSARSHQFPGWKWADEKETIPYGAVYLDDRELTEEEKDYGLKLELELG